MNTKQNKQQKITTLLSLTLALAVSLSALTGCTGTQKKDAPTKEPTKQTQTVEDNKKANTKKVDDNKKKSEIKKADDSKKKSVVKKAPAEQTQAAGTTAAKDQKK